MRHEPPSSTEYRESSASWSYTPRAPFFPASFPPSPENVALSFVGTAPKSNQSLNSAETLALPKSPFLMSNIMIARTCESNTSTSNFPCAPVTFLLPPQVRKRFRRPHQVARLFLYESATASNHPPESRPSKLISGGYTSAKTASHPASGIPSAAIRLPEIALIAD